MWVGVEVGGRTGLAAFEGVDGGVHGAHDHRQQRIQPVPLRTAALEVHQVGGGVGVAGVHQHRRVERIARLLPVLRGVEVVAHG